MSQNKLPITVSIPTLNSGDGKVKKRLFVLLDELIKKPKLLRNLEYRILAQGFDEELKKELDSIVRGTGIIVDYVERQQFRGFFDLRRMQASFVETEFVYYHDDDYHYSLVDEDEWLSELDGMINSMRKSSLVGGFVVTKISRSRLEKSKHHVVFPLRTNCHARFLRTKDMIDSEEGKEFRRYWSKIKVIEDQTFPLCVLRGGRICVVLNSDCCPYILNKHHKELSGVRNALFGVPFMKRLTEFYLSFVDRDELFLLFNRLARDLQKETTDFQFDFDRNEPIHEGQFKPKMKWIERYQEIKHNQNWFEMIYDEFHTGVTVR